MAGAPNRREQYAQDVSSPPAAASSSRVPRAVARSSVSIALWVLGAVIDICAVANVPGATVFPLVDGADGGVLKVTSLGGALALVAVIAWSTVLWRRRRPVFAMAAGAVLALVGLSYLLLLIGAVRFVRVRPAATVRTGILVGICVLGFTARELFTPWGGALAWFLTSRVEAVRSVEWSIVVVACAVVSLASAAGAVVLARARDRMRRSERRAEVQLHRADALAEQATRQGERERIARDMHDALAHRLSVVSLHAGALEAAVDTDGQIGEIARTVREQTHAALQDMRGLIGDLRGEISGRTTPMATMRGLGGLVAGLRSAGHAVTSLIMIESPERAGAILDSAVFRIVQESLTNAVKHAPGVPIDVIVQVSPTEGGRVRVENPLAPGTAGQVPGGRNGVLGIRERAESLGGEAWIGPYDGSFIVDVSLPWQERG